MDWATVIPAAGQIIGSLIGGNDKKKEQQQTKRAQDFAEAQYQTQVNMWMREHFNSIRDKVADAKKAGLHPLFALGGGMGGGGGGFIPGQFPTGNWADGGSLSGGLGSAIADASAGIGNALGQREAQASQQKLDDLQASLLTAQIGEVNTKSLLNQSEAERAMSEARAVTARTMQGLVPNFAATASAPAGEKFQSIVGELVTDPSMSDSEQASKWFGDTGQEAVGLRNMAKAMWGNMFGGAGKRPWFGPENYWVKEIEASKRGLQSVGEFLLGLARRSWNIW